MKRTSITLALAAVIAATAMILTSCGGNDNNGVTDGTVTVSMNETDGGATDNMTDILDGTTESR